MDSITNGRNIRFNHQNAEGLGTGALHAFIKAGQDSVMPMQTSGDSAIKEWRIAVLYGDSYCLICILYI